MVVESGPRPPHAGSQVWAAAGAANAKNKQATIGTVIEIGARHGLIGSPTDLDDREDAGGAASEKLPRLTTHARARFPIIPHPRRSAPRSPDKVTASIPKTHTEEKGFSVTLGSRPTARWVAAVQNRQLRPSSYEIAARLSCLPVGSALQGSRVMMMTAELRIRMSPKGSNSGVPKTEPVMSAVLVTLVPTKMPTPPTSPARSSGRRCSNP